MTWVAVAIGGTAVVGAISSSNASHAQQQSANQADQTQLAEYNQTRADQAPWRAAGQKALDNLSAGTAPGGQYTKQFGDTQFRGDPGYQFRLQQGQDALDNQAASRGRLLSGAQLKGAAEYNQNFASNEYGNAYNRFMDQQNTQFNRQASIAGLGQTANSMVAQAGQNMANNVSANQIGAGNAQASGYMGMSNAFTNGLSSYMNYNQGQNMVNALSSKGSSSYAPSGSFNYTPQDYSLQTPKTGLVD